MFALCSCLTNKTISDQDIVGHYSVPTKIHPITLTLHEDGTFEYKHLYQFGSSIDQSWSSGEWEIREKNKLVLQSKFQPNEKSVDTHQLTVLENLDTDSTKFKLSTDNGKPVPFATILLKKAGNVVTGNVTNFDGNCSLPLENADIVYVNHPGFKEIEIIYEKIKGKSCVIEMSYFPADYQFFSDQAFLIRPGKIIFNEFWPEFGSMDNIRKRFFEKEKRTPTTPK